MITIEIQWNAERQRYDIKQPGALTHFHQSKGAAEAIAVRQAKALITAGTNAAVVLIGPDGKRGKISLE